MDTPTICTDDTSNSGTTTIPTIGASNQRTTSWAVSFDSLLSDPSGLFAFKLFLEKEFSAENIHFWIACRRLRSMNVNDDLKIKTEVRAIYDHYLSANPIEPVNIDNQARNKAKIEAADAGVNSFLDAELQIYNLMKHDSYQRFLKSDIFSQFVKKEAAGKELPQLDIKTGRIKKSSHGIFSWKSNQSSSFKIHGSKLNSANAHKRLSLSIRPKSLNFDSNSVSTTPSGTSSRAASHSLSSSHRDLSPSSYDQDSQSSSCKSGSSSKVSFLNKNIFHHSTSKTIEITKDTQEPSSPTYSCLSPNVSSLSYELYPSETYPSPPPISVTRKTLFNNPVPITSTKYDFFTSNDQTTEPKRRTDGRKIGGSKSNLEKAEDDLLSSIISASQKLPRRTVDGDNFDSPRDLYRFLSQPDLLSPAFIDMDTTNETNLKMYKMGSYLSPSLGDVANCGNTTINHGGGGQRYSKNGHRHGHYRGHRRNVPPPPPVAYGKPLPFIPNPGEGQSSSSSSAGRTPLKPLPTNYRKNYDQYSEVIV